MMIISALISACFAENGDGTFVFNGTISNIETEWDSLDLLKQNIAFAESNIAKKELEIKAAKAYIKEYRRRVKMLEKRIKELNSH